MLKEIVFLLLISLSAQWCLKQTFNELAGSQINEIDWSPDGNFIVTGSGSNRVTVFSSVTSNVVWFKEYSNIITTTKFSKTGKWLGVGQTGDDTIFIYNVPTWTQSDTFRAEHGNSETVFQLDFNSDDTKLATCASDGKVNQRVLSTRGYDFKSTIDTSKDVISCKYSSNNKIGLSCTDGEMYLLKSDGTVDEKEPKNLVKDVDFRPGSQRYLYGGCTCDKKLYQFDTNSDNINTYIDPNKDQIWAVSHSLDNTFIATGGKNGHTHIINTTTRASPSIEAYFKESNSHINSVRVSNNNNFVAVSRVDGVIHIYARNCMQCPLGYYTNLTKCRMCSLDLTGCAGCRNSSKCQTCHSNYYLDSTSQCKLCEVSLEGCYQCKNSSVCTACSQTHYLTGNTCTKCKQTTSECQQCMNNGTCIKCSYYTYLTASNTCSLCNNSITNCLACYLQQNNTSPTGSTLYCRQCVQGYYASTTQCLPCSANCNQCLRSGQCIACAQEFKLVGTSCAKCDQYCQACLENGTCLQCIANTFLGSGTCTACAFPCLTCATAANSCRSCVLGYYYVSGTNTCSKCVGCPICNPISGVCLSCPVGQYLQTPANTCAYCLNTTSKCQICTASTCLACQRNYYLTGSNTCARTATITDCIVYQKNSTTDCEHCNFGLYLDSGTGNCVQCLKQCSACDNSNNCTQCQVGYYMFATNATCLPCTGNCRACNSSTECLSCGDQYYLSGTACLKCWDQIPYCNSCLNSTHCLDCYLGYQLASNSLSCTQCVSPCATCDSSGCLSCQEGYFYATGTCTRCPNSCVECTSASVCQACAVGYALDGSNACVSCATLFPNCLYCSYSACQTCKQYFTLNTTSSSCVDCPTKIPNCLKCTPSANTCDICTVGYYPASTNLSCIACSVTMPNCQKCVSGTSCDECQTGFYPSAVNVCSRCISGCLVCSAGGVCDICETGWVKVAGVCKECSEYVFGCQMCTLASGCSNCLIGYYRVSSTSCSLCRGAIEGCSTCNSSTICTGCDAGYFLNSTNKCQKCTSSGDCSICSSGTVCAQCLAGYFLNSSQCQLCPTAYPRCGVCNASQCLMCQTGSYFSSGSCTLCTATYGQGCIICNTTRCQQCQSGFYLASNGTCQICGLTGCQLCSPNGLTCLSCENTFYKTGSTCTSCETMDMGCISCSGLNTCLLCKSGYYLETNGTCLLCENKFAGCDVCSSSRCSDCESNYFHNTTSVAGDCVLCRQLLPGCSLCINQASCLLCESGYYLDTLQCTSCTVLPQCLICQDNTTCLFCAVGYYLQNGACHSCSTAITGCFSCASRTVCTTCSGSWTMSVGVCVEVKGVEPQNYSNVRIVSEYVNGTHLKHSLYVNGISFKKIQQQWTANTKIELVTPPNNKTSLTIIAVEWGSSIPISALIFYTNNPFGQLSAASSQSQSLPLVKFGRRVLLTLDDLNIGVNFNIQKAVINEILPELDTSGQDLALEYKLNSPEFYKSVVKTQRYHYYLFGLTTVSILLLVYLIKICFVLPATNDAGEIIPHFLLVKMPAMVIYPSLGGYINYCYGFTYLDFPWLNQFFSGSLSNLSDTSPQSYQMFYHNLSISSTYFLALLVFLALFLPLKAYSLYKHLKKFPSKHKTLSVHSNSSISVLDKPVDRLETFTQFLYNVFIAGLTVSSFGCIIGMMYNPASVVTSDGIFYILGILIYTVIVIGAVKSFSEVKAKFNRIRVVIKGTFLSLLFWSPVPLFAAMALLDTAIMLYEYKLKLKQWVVPKIWLLNQVLCLLAYGALIFLSSTLLGIIVASVCLVAVLACDAYLQYAEHLEIEKIRDLRQSSKEYTENNLSIEGFIPDRRQKMDSRAGDLFLQEEYPEKKKVDNNTFYSRNSSRQTKQKSQSDGFLESQTKVSSMNLTGMEPAEQKARNTFTIKGLLK